MARELPKKPVPKQGGGKSRPSPIPDHMRALTKNDAQMVNLDNGTHVDSKGVEHHTHEGNKPQVGPLTLIIATSHGHAAKRFGEHARDNTNVHKHMRARGRPSASQAARDLLKAHQGLPRALPRTG